MCWRLKDVPAHELGQNHLPEGKLLLENALPRVLLRSGWVQVCQAAAVGSHRSTDSWADEKLSHICCKICVIVPVTQCLTEISHPFYIFKKQMKNIAVINREVNQYSRLELFACRAL